MSYQPQKRPFLDTVTTCAGGCTSLTAPVGTCSNTHGERSLTDAEEENTNFSNLWNYFFFFCFFSTKLKVFYLPRALSVHRLLTGLRTALHFFSSFLHQLQCMEEQRILLLKRAGNQITAPKLHWYGYDGVKERQNLINKQEKVNFWEKHFFIVFEPPISPLQMSYGR